MSDEGGEVEVTEQVALGRIDRLCNFEGLLRVCLQLVHLGDKQLVVAVGLYAAAAR